MFRHSSRTATPGIDGSPDARSSRAEPRGARRWNRLGGGVLVIVGLGLAATLPATSSMAASKAKAIIITKKTDQSTPELFSNFHATAGLEAKGRLAQVSGTIACTGGLGEQHLARVRVKVTQRGVTAEGFALGRCTGNVEPWSAIVITQGAKRFKRGTATGHAWVGVPRFGSGMSRAAFDWSHSITLLP